MGGTPWPATSSSADGPKRPPAGTCSAADCDCWLVESIDRRKQARIIACASHYLQQHPGLAARPARFDVVAIAADDQVSWIPDAFQS